MIAELFSVTAPVFVIIAIGFCWAKIRPNFQTSFVTSLVMYIGTPMLVVSAFYDSRPDPALFGEIALATAITAAIVLSASFLFLRVTKQSPGDLTPAMSFSNTGNMGLSITLFAFGSVGLSLGLVVFTLITIINFTIGVAILRGRIDFKSILKMPLIYAAAFALAIIFLDFQLPVWMERSVSLLGGMTIPLMLLALGVSLARLKASDFLKSLWLSLSRTAICISAAILVAWTLGLDPLIAKVLVLQFAMPVAVFNYLLASEYHRDSEQVAGMVVVSTALSLGYLPIVLAFLL